MDTRQLVAFIAVADAGGFSKAAAELDISQSALSRQIAVLESEFAVRLFIRTGRGVVLSEAGARLLRNARSMIELAARTRDEIADLEEAPRGRITVGLPARVGAMAAAAIVSAFRRDYPHARLTLFEGMSHHLQESLVAGRLDVALMFDPIPIPRVSYETLYAENMVFAGPRSGRRLPKRMPLEQLAGWPLILASGAHTMRMAVDAAARRDQVALNIVAEVDSLRGLLALVAGGHGYSIVPEFAAMQSQEAAKIQVARIGPPALISKLVLAVPQSGTSSKLLNGSLRLLRQMPFRRLASMREGESDVRAGRSTSRTRGTSGVAGRAGLDLKA